MGVRELQQVWEEWARADPMWAVLSEPTKAGRRWDAEEFFATGRDEINSVMAALAERGIPVTRGRCLDFGCGVGRLTRALAEHFDIAEGVDIAPSMVRQAGELNRDRSRMRFHVNDRPDLEQFESASFDLIYSNIVLQHIEPEISEIYVREFIRLLTDGGVAVFQVPSTRTEAPETSRLPDAAHRAVLSAATSGLKMDAGSTVSLSVSVRNASPSPWPYKPELRLGNHWLDASGQLVVLDDGRTGIPETLEPGAGTEVTLPITAPSAPGPYLLELDLVEESVCWFAERGSTTERVPVEVGRAGRLRSRIRGRQRATPRPFEMYGLPKARVVAAVEESGGRVLDIEPYNPAGAGWESYRYYVTRP